MALTPVPTIDPALPIPPNPADDEAVFDAKAYAWSNALPGFGGDVKAIGDATYANAQWAETKAGDAATQAVLATTNGAAQVALAAAQVSIAAGHASNASTSANNAADSATAASESATEAEGMVEKYQGALAADPVLDKSGGPLTDGDWYVSTVTGLIRAYTVAGGWVNGLSAVAGVSSVNGEAGAITGVLKASGGTLTGALNEAPALTLASATTTDIGAQNSNNITITGTTTITSFGSAAAGVIRRLVFAGALTLTHSASNLILPGAANIVTAAGDTAEFLSLGAGSWRCVVYQRASGSSVVAPPTIANLVRSVRGSNIALGVADKGTLIDFSSGTFTQTFAAVSTLGNGWWCYIRNAGTGDITLDPNASELIDGLTSYVMYPGEMRLVMCDGNTLRTVVINSFYRVFTTSDNFIKPPGYSFISGLLWGGGGSGRKGGAEARGGGGGACHPFRLKADSLANTVAVTIGAGGALSGGDGNRGGTSSLGTLVEAGGGYGGIVSGGGGGGGAWVGTAFDGPGGSDYGPVISAGSTNTAYFGGGSANPSNNTLAYQNSHYGGAAGGTIGGGTVYSPGVSRLGGSGGAASLTGSGSAGAEPGGGGGATNTGAASGSGARGELRIWGEV